MLLSLATAACAAACNGSSSRSPEVLVLQANQAQPLTTDEFDYFYFAWTPLADASVYVLEFRAVPDAFQELARTQGYHRLPEGTPELVGLEFRLRALLADGSARISNTVAHGRGVRPPSFSCPYNYRICDLTSGAFQLSWRIDSSVADEFALERQVSDDSSVGTWQALPGTPSAGSCTDADTAAYRDCARYRYRLSVGKGSTWSDPIEVGSLPAPPLAPVHASATTTPHSVRIQFENASACANMVRIFRRRSYEKQDARTKIYEGPPLAVGALFWGDDFNLTPGAYAYDIVAIRRYIDWDDWSPTTTVYGVPPLPASTGLAARIVDAAPGVRYAARTSSGSWALAVTPHASSQWFLLPPGDSGSHALELPNLSSLWPSGIELDSNERPHAFYGSGDIGSSLVTYAWFDGETWQQEVVPTGSEMRAWGAALGPDGTPYLAWNEYRDDRLKVAKRSAGAWEVEDVSTALGPGLNLFPSTALRVAVDAAGRAHILLGEQLPGYHVFQAGDGWHQELVPAPDWITSTTPLQLFAGAGGVSILSRSYDWTARAYSVTLLERGPEGWSAPILLSGGTASAFAISADRSRIGLVVYDSGQEKLLIRASGITAEWDLYLSAGPVGLGPDGKAWVLSPLQWDPAPLGQPAPAILFEEL
jgi:hypothetical protein